MAQVFLRQSYPPAAVCGQAAVEAFDDQYFLFFKAGDVAAGYRQAECGDQSRA
ncbi:hypothetical protein D3C85_1764520 [compost metagenome]